MEKYYRAKEVAEMLAVHKATVYRWLADKRLGSIKIEGIRRIRQSDLDQFLKKNA